MSETNANKDAAKGEAAASGGLKAWLPLILVVVLMPVLALVMTNYVLLPKLQKSLGVEAVSAREGGGDEGGHEVAKNKGPKVKVPLNKLIVNVAGALGARLLCASVTLAGSAPDFKTKVEDNTDQLRDIAAGVLGSKTISDLEKPEARNLIRAELLSQFNAVLGGSVQEIYLTEFAIQ
jgi:flagellar protein FliL